MPATLSSIKTSARNEWTTWGKSSWNVITNKKKLGHIDDEVSFAQHVIDHYCSVGGGSPSVKDIQNDKYFWSAVGMSAIMKGAGFTKSEFPFAQSHSTFIRHFIAKRKAGKAAAYWGFRHQEKGGEPQEGDIVAYARGKKMTAAKAAKLFNSTSSYESHSDVVVAVRPGEIDVIGANVLDSVTVKTLALDANGHISDPHHFWFAVLKRQ